jgi:hypothetical protein
MNASDVVVNAIGGGIVGFAGTWVIGLMRSPKMLDEERLAEIAGRDATILEQSQKIAQLEIKPKRTPSQQARFDLVQDLVDRQGTRAVTVVKFLRTHGAVVFGPGQVTGPPGMSIDAFRNTLNTLAGGVIKHSTSFPHPTITEEKYELAPGLFEAVDELLY